MDTSDTSDTSQEASIDQEDADLQRARGPWLSFLGGVVLFASLFMPAFQGCNDDAIRPIAVPLAAWPHFMGMFVVVGASLALLRDRSGPEVMALVLYLLALAASGILGLVLLADFPETAAYPLALSCVLVAVMRTRPLRLSRAVWICGLYACAWLGFFVVVEPAAALYGLWVSIGGAALMTLGGALWDRDERIPVEPPVPEATVVRSGGDSAG